MTVDARVSARGRCHGVFDSVACSFTSRKPSAMRRRNCARERSACSRRGWGSWVSAAGEVAASWLQKRGERDRLWTSEAELGCGAGGSCWAPPPQRPCWPRPRRLVLAQVGHLAAHKIDQRKSVSLRLKPGSPASQASAGRHRGKSGFGPIEAI